MLSRRIVAACRSGTAVRAVQRTPIVQQRFQSYSPQQTAQYDYPNLSEAEDPGMNGGYINPPAIKRQFRDPYGDWWDKQERRNYGEPVHEDNDIMGLFSPEEYTHVTPGKGALQIACFVAVFLTLCGAVAMTYPDRPSAPKEYEGGLERELGGPGAVRARSAGDDY
ncbi:NADH:ubiquinone oxidoreductase 20.1kD subunit [Xylogone sp. PMI_703]|nr:NADH:ubiquinone oxidoreductase 20.1kD subunit [Xylogone sp. PMI_703]